MRLLAPATGLLVTLLACSPAADLPDRAFDDVPLPGLGLRVGIEPLDPIVEADAEGGHHLFYELRLSGLDPRVLTLDSLEVLGMADSAVRLRMVGADELDRLIYAPGRSDRRRITPGSLAILFLAVGAGAFQADSIVHHAWLSHRGPSGVTTAELVTAGVPVERPAWPSLGPPLRGGPWYAHSGPANLSHHRNTVAPQRGRLTMDQRFATDWFRLGTGEGGAVMTGPDWQATMAAEAIAVADAEVAAVMTGLADQPIGPLGDALDAVTWENIGGNRVVLDLGGGRYAWYHHLQEGSITVAVGERVRRGQVLGRVGNSGNTSHPHLHFEVTDATVLGLGNGLPYRLDCYRQAMRVDPMPGWTPVAESDPAKIGLAGPLQAAEFSELHRDEIPLGGAVVWFGDSATGCGDPGP